jgi:hypothetical protein
MVDIMSIIRYNLVVARADIIINKPVDFKSGLCYNI